MIDVVGDGKNGTVSTQRFLIETKARAWEILTASSKSSSGNLGWITSWPCWTRNVGLLPPGTACQPCRKRIFMGAFYAGVIVASQPFLLVHDSLLAQHRIHRPTSL